MDLNILQRLKQSINDAQYEIKELVSAPVTQSELNILSDINLLINEAENLVVQVIQKNISE